MEWRQAEIRLAELLGEKAMAGLEAVAVMAVCPKADPESPLKLAIDDFKITGWRRKEFVFLEPATHRLEEFGVSVAGVHFDEAADLRLRGAFPGAVDRAEISVDSVMRPGRMRRFPLRKTAGLSFEAVISCRHLGPGLWRAEIKGLRRGREFSAGTLVFLVRSKEAPDDHPFLLLTEKDKPRLRQLVLQGRSREIWEKLQDSARAFRQKFDPESFHYNLDAYDEIFWLPTYGGYSNTIRTLSSFARNNAFVYALGGEKEAGEAARRALLKMAAWPSFVHPHILNQGQFTYWPVGLVLIDLALAYDMIYDLLGPSERQTIASALYKKGITEVYKEYVRDNRVSSNTSNWISHVAGGGILSALAVSREYPDRELEPYLTGMILKTADFVAATFDRDGHYGEGYGYHNFTMQTLSEIMPVLETHFGIVFPEKVFHSFLYLPYQMNAPAGEIYDFGDTSPKLSSMSNFAYLLKKTQDPLLRWLYSLAPGDRDVDLLFDDERTSSEPPLSRLPLVKLFRDTGTVVFRSGFGWDDFLFVFRAGPFYNHQHFDQGTFFLRDKGQDFLVEGGRTDYYNDPWYQSFFIQPGGHNCLLPDGDPESQTVGDLKFDVPAWQNYARITDFLEFQDGAILSAELAPIYRQKFQSLRRNILYFAPRTIILFDLAEGSRDVDALHLRFHPPRKKDIQSSPPMSEIHRGGRTLWIKSLFPESIRSEVKKRPLSLSEFGAENPITMSARGFLELAADIDHGGCRIINVLSSDEETVRRTRLEKKTGFFDLMVGSGRFLINQVPGSGYEIEGIGTDSLAFCRRDDGFIAFRASEVSEDSRTLFKAGIPVSLRLEKEKRSVSLHLWAANPTRIQLLSSARPKSVRLDGRPIKTWEYAAPFVALEIPAERSWIQVEY